MHTNVNSAGVFDRALRAILLPLMLSLFGCGGGGSSGETPPAPGQPGSIVLPEDLHGQWETVLTYVPPFYGGPLGSAPQGDGSLGIAFYFWPDGRYQHRWNLLSAYFGGNCFRTARWDEFGTMSGAGPEFTFNPGKANYIQTDSCGESKILDPAPVEPADHSLTLDRDNTGWPLLRISFPTGELVLEKCRSCQ